MAIDPKLLSRTELEAEVSRLRARCPDVAGSDRTRDDVAPGRSTLTDASLLFSAVEKTGLPMIVSDPNQPDDPIVFVNRAFLEMSGYDADEILGRNCRFLQGPDTEDDRLA